MRCHCSCNIALQACQLNWQVTGMAARAVLCESAGKQNLRATKMHQNSTAMTSHAAAAVGLLLRAELLQQYSLHQWLTRQLQQLLRTCSVLPFAYMQAFVISCRL